VGTSGKKQLIIQLDGSKYKVFTLDFDTGVPTQTESYPYAASSAGSETPSGQITPAD
jgi:serine/threonine-protein kinase